MQLLLTNTRPKMKDFHNTYRMNLTAAMVGRGVDAYGFQKVS